MDIFGLRIYTYIYTRRSQVHKQISMHTSYRCIQIYIYIYIHIHTHNNLPEGYLEPWGTGAPELPTPATPAAKAAAAHRLDWPPDRSRLEGEKPPVESGLSHQNTQEESDVT